MRQSIMQPPWTSRRMRRKTPPDERLNLLCAWAEKELGPGSYRWAPASEDASFRRYFRVRGAGVSRIGMDAPPEQEDLRPYLQVQAVLAGSGVHVPTILARDLAQGFLLLSDLGGRQYLAALEQDADPDGLLFDAITALVRLQARGTAQATALPAYDAALLQREMALFPEWFLGRHLGLTANAKEREMLTAVFDKLCKNAAAQPQVLVHRDYHSRNLMVCPGANPGVLDFQDAVRGPVTYDLVSLLKDCYIVWPRRRQLAWLSRYRKEAAAAGLNAGPDEPTFVQWYDLMGLQRHLKVLGIFARLWYRDGKVRYLADLPRVLDYVLEVTSATPEFADFDHYLRKQVQPAFVLARQRMPQGT